jgi:transcriptional regulator with XRE-family HTH domain
MKSKTEVKASSIAQSGPAKLFDVVMDMFKLENDRALARLLEVSPSLISKARNQRMPVTDDLLLRIHEETDMPIREIKSYLGKKPRRLVSQPYLSMASQHA